MLTTSRLILRRPLTSDVSSLFEIYGDPQTNLHNPSGPHSSIERSASVLAGWIAHWERHGFGQFAVATRSDPSEVVGFGGIAYRKFGEADALNLGFRFGVSAWGHDYATELSLASLEYAFATLQALEVLAVVRPRNLSSSRVLEKIGMRRFGVLDDVPGQEPSHLFKATPGKS